MPVRRGAPERGRTRSQPPPKPGDEGAQSGIASANALTADQHDDDEHEANPELPILRRQGRDPVLQEFIDQRADQAAIEITGAADDEDEEKISRTLEREHIERAECGRL